MLCATMLTKGDEKEISAFFVFQEEHEPLISRFVGLLGIRIPHDVFECFANPASSKAIFRGRQCGPEVSSFL